MQDEPVSRENSPSEPPKSTPAESASRESAAASPAPSESTPSETAPTGSASTAGGATVQRLALRPILGLVFGLLGGGVAVGLLFWPASYPWFVPSLKVDLVEADAQPPAGETPEERAARHSLERKNRAFAVGMLGVLLGGLLGIGEGLGRKSVRSVLSIGIAGILLGALFGCLGGIFGHLVTTAYEGNADTSDMLVSMLIQAVTFASLGLGIGLMLGLSTKRARVTIRAVFGGVLAGVMAAAIYGIGVAVCFPNVHANAVIPDGFGGELIGAYLMWAGAGTLLIGFIVPSVAETQ